MNGPPPGRRADFIDPVRDDTLPVTHFEALYAARPDPWRLETSAYERDKYAATLSALPRARYRSAFEIGCAKGVFTSALAHRCDTLLAVEPVGQALEEAKARNADRPSVRFAPMFVPGDWPEARFDLIVLSEVIDYLGAADVLRLARRLAASLEPDGHAILVHWIGKKTGPPSGEEASDRLIAALAEQVEVLRAERTRDYRLDLLRRL